MTKTTRFRRIVLFLWLFVAPFAAQERLARIEGTVIDVEGDPVVGARVVYRLTDTEDVFITEPTNERGAFSLDLPEGRPCQPIAVHLVGGSRVELGNVSPTPVAEGMSQRITIEVPRRWNPSAVVQNFPGSDRLFQSFVEDTAIVDRYRVETRVQRQDGDSVDRGILSVVGAAQFPAIPEVEFGARLTVVGVDVDGGPGGDGLGDTELWAKYVLGPTSDSRHELAFGALVTLATGDEDEGTGFDSNSSKLFVAARRELPWGVLTGNLGLRLTGDGSLFGSPLDGKISPSVSVGAIAPWTYRMAFVGEAHFEGERYDGADTEASVLGGVNFLLKEGSLRAAVAIGLADGSPDTELTVGYAFHF